MEIRNIEADLLIIGGGSAGCMSAIRALELNPELKRIQKMLQSFLNTTQDTLHLTYLLLDGHFGNYPAHYLVRQCHLHLISKLRHDAALHFPYSGPSPKRGPTPRLGE